jgi:hypothetical protein
MNFDLTPEQEEFRRVVRDFARDVVWVFFTNPSPPDTR